MSVMSPSNQVKHYRIRKLDSGGFFISNKVRFQNMVELVSHYRTQADGLWYDIFSDTYGFYFLYLAVS